MSDHWEVDPPRPTILGRLLVPQGATAARPAITAFLLGLLGTAAFVGSLVLDWHRVTMVIPRNTGQAFGGEEVAIATSLSNVDILGQVYLLGTIAMLGLLGSVLTRPDLALRMRMAAAGVGVGLAAVVVATAMRMPDAAYGSADYVLFGGSAFVDGLRASTRVAYEPGLFCAAGAVVLLTAGVWFAGRSAARPQAASPAPAHPAAAVDDGPAHPAPSTKVVPAPAPARRVDELTVSASEPLDLSVNPEAWSR